MADVEIEVTDSGLLDVRIGRRRVAHDLIDIEEVAQWIDGYVTLPCPADWIEADGYRSEVVVPSR